MGETSKKQDSDIIIIGGGIIGLFSAYYLTMAGKTVRIIEQKKVGSGSSHANCGLLVFSDLAPLCTPGTVQTEFIRLLKGQSPLSIKPGINIPLWKFLYLFWTYCNEKSMNHALVVRKKILDLSRELFEDFFKIYNPCEWKKQGVFIVCKGQNGLNKYRKTNELLESFGLGAEILSKDELLQREPALKENIAGGYLHSIDSHLKPDSLVDFLKEYLKTQKVIFEENCIVKNFSIKNNKVTKIYTSKGEFTADKFVIAAGAWSGLLLKNIGISIPVEPGKGYSITMQRPYICPRSPCYMYESNVVATPFQTGYRLGGTMEFTGFDLSLNQKRLIKIKEAAVHYMKEPFGEPVIEEWTSLRPMCADDIPIISRLPGKENTIVATGHGMMGITMSTGTGKLVSDMICEKNTDISIEHFSINRFAI